VAKKRQESPAGKKMKQEQHAWAEQSGKNPDDLEIGQGTGGGKPASGKKL
jgi:hypothetical protein